LFALPIQLWTQLQEEFLSFCETLTIRLDLAYELTWATPADALYVFPRNSVRKNDASALEHKENSLDNKRKPSKPLVPLDAKNAPSTPTPST